MNDFALLLKIKKSHRWYSINYHYTRLRAEYVSIFRGHLYEFSIDNYKPKNTENKIKKFLLSGSNHSIVLMDSQIDISVVLISVLKHGNGKIIKIIIPIHGDIVKQMFGMKSALKACEKSGTNIQIKYITPCQRIANALAYITGSKKGIFIKRLYYYFPQSPDSIRPFNELIIDYPGSHIFGYAGRIEIAKNILLMIDTFSKKEIYSKSILLLAGDIDTRIFLFGNKTSKRKFNDFKNILFKKIASKNIDVQKRIIFLGNLNAKDIFRFYSTIDTLINLSTYIGEDFGIVNCQSLGMGKNTISTDWAGFADHSKHFSQLTYIPVTTTSNGQPKIDKDILFQEMKKSLVNNYYPSKIKNRPRGLKEYSLDKIVSSKKYSSSKVINLINEKTWTEFMAGERNNIY